MATRGRLECLLQHIGRDPSVVQHQCSSSSTDEEGRIPADLQQNLEEINLGPRIHAHPKSGLNDELLDIRVDGLHPGQKVMLRAHIFSECRKYRFESSAEYIADTDGKVTVNTDPSVGGSYTGVEPMGLIWGVEPSPEGIKDWPRLVKKNISKPFVYHFRVLDEGGRELAASSVERWFLADYVQRILVTHGKADGCLYLPKQKGSSDPMPVLIDVRGGVHYLVEDRPGLMASHGFATFSLNYYRKMVGKNQVWSDEISYFDMQIFVDLFDYIKIHPRLDINRVGIVSSCLGSILSLNAAARLKHLPIKCIAATGCPDELAGAVGLKLLDGMKIDPYGKQIAYGKVTEVEDGSYYFEMKEDDHDTPKGDHKIPAEDITVPMLFFIPGADKYIPSGNCMNRMIERIDQAGHKHLLEVVHLEGAGHFIDAPYLCLCKHFSMTQGREAINLFSTHGGDLRLHAHALETTWRKTINWFRQQLDVTEIYRDDWLDPQPQHITSTNV